MITGTNRADCKFEQRKRPKKVLTALICDYLTALVVLSTATYRKGSCNTIACIVSHCCTNLLVSSLLLALRRTVPEDLYENCWTTVQNVSTVPKHQQEITRGLKEQGTPSLFVLSVIPLALVLLHQYQCVTFRICSTCKAYFKLWFQWKLELCC